MDSRRQNCRENQSKNETRNHDADDGRLWEGGRGVGSAAAGGGVLGGWGRGCSEDGKSQRRRHERVRPSLILFLLFLPILQGLSMSFSLYFRYSILPFFLSFSFCLLLFSRFFPLPPLVPPRSGASPLHRQRPEEKAICMVFPSNVNFHTLGRISINLMDVG